MTGSGVSRFQRNAEGLGGATCAKLIWFRAAPGRHDEYSAYLHDHVEPIDHEAVREGALLNMITLLNPTGDTANGSSGGQQDAQAPSVAAVDPTKGWTHLRIFLFESAAQRAAVKDAFARIAPRVEPDANVRASRKAAGTALRTLVAEQDLDLLG